MRSKPTNALWRRWNGVAAGAIAMALLAPGCYRPPTVEEPPASPAARRSTIVAYDGTLLATLFTENRDPVAFGDVPKILVDAVVAAEDQRFWSHKGVDLKAILRAGLRNVSEKEAVQGGSTITQQYVKNVYFPIDRPRTFRQKVREAEIALRLEEHHSKREIMEKYLNTVYFGDGAYGVKAAAEEFFRKPIASLSLAEAALLAGIIRSPESDNPRRNFQRAYARRAYVLARMRTLRMITPDEEGAASAQSLGVLPPPQRAVLEPHFVEYIKQSIINDPVYGDDEADRAALLFRGGIQIKTTIDPRLQQIARQAIGDVLGRPGDPEVALVSIETKTGKIRAMVGGRNFRLSQVDLTLGRKGGGSGRQSGSAFKPIVLAAAFDDGMRAEALYSASPPVIRVSRSEVWRPKNAEGGGGGMLSLTNATIHSVNAVFARLGMDVGPARIARMGQRMGITAELNGHPSISLGAEEVSPLDMAAAFSTLANYGLQVTPKPVETIRMPGGTRFVPETRVRRAFDPGIAWMVTDILRRVITEGTGKRADIGRPAAGKTGTSQDYADAWFVGYTPELVTAVWVGYPEGRISMRNVHGIRVFGGTFPAQIWSLFMSRALSGSPAIDFELPWADMVTIEIDPATGLRAGPYCSGGETVTMLKQLAPTQTCPSPSPAPSPAETAPPTEPSPAAEPAASPNEEPQPSPSPSPSP